MTDHVFLGAICDYFGHDEEVINCCAELKIDYNSAKRVLANSIW